MTKYLALCLWIPIALAQNPPSRVVGKMIWEGQVVHYEVVDGRIVIDGDVSIGDAVELPALQDHASPKLQPHSDVTPGIPPAVWPNGIVPYEIDPAIPNPQRVTDAVAQWNQKTPLRFVPHGNETTFLRFVRDTSTAGACSTLRNISGGQQTIRTLDSCPAGMLAHEIGHVVGLNHEHQRADRDYYVQIFPQYLEKIRDSDLDLEVSGGVDMGPYDFGSLMHYGRYFTLRNPKNSTMETIPAGIVMGLLTDLSDGDIDQIRRIYGAVPTATTISTNPPGLQVIVDGTTVTAPQSFNWAAGSTHTVDIAGPQFLPGDANTRYTYGRWSDNQPQAHTITASAAVTVFEISFIQQFRLTTGAAPATGGSVTVSPASSDGFYTNNTMVTLTAAATAPNRFLVWGPTGILGQYHGYSDNPVTFPMKSALTYTATFTTDTAYTIASNPPDLQVTVDGFTPVAPRSFNWAAGSAHINRRRRQYLQSVEHRPLGLHRMERWRRGHPFGHCIAHLARHHHRDIQDAVLTNDRSQWLRDHLRFPFLSRRILRSRYRRDHHRQPCNRVQAIQLEWRPARPNHHPDAHHVGRNGSNCDLRQAIDHSGCQHRQLRHLSVHAALAW